MACSPRSVANRLAFTRMTRFTLILRSFRFHARAHLGAVLGAAVGTAVLVGALVVGDSVRLSLLDLALSRVGRAWLALSTGDRFFQADLEKRIGTGTNLAMATALALPGTAATGDGAARANQVQVLGVDSAFWSLALATTPDAAIPADEVLLNERLATQLAAKAGDTVVLRVSKPSQLSRDAPISAQEDYAVGLRVKVRAVLNDQQAGRFSLQASQVPPFSAFVSRTWLQQRVGLTNRANLLLTGKSGEMTPSRNAAWLRSGWQLADLELELREAPAWQSVELRTSRVFLDPPVADAALASATNAVGVLTYFVNELRAGERATPYSMVTATGAPIVPPEMRDDEILINDWLAKDLNAKPGDTVKLTYYVVGAMRQLEEQSASFRVRAVIPLAGPAADRTLMPDFPGMANAQNCRDWDAGFPITLDRIRDQDNKYWEEHKGTPKAFVTLAAGQKLWSNRFGNLTAIRFPSPVGAAASEFRDRLATNLTTRIDPALAGMSFIPIGQQAITSVEQGQDFGQLFIGFSFFLITAALILMSLLFQFSIEQRAVETGTLLALGFTPKQVRRLFLLEGGLLAVVGGLVGALGGAGYAKAMLGGLSTIWQDAVKTSALTFHGQPGTIVAGTLAGIVVGWFTIWLALRKQVRLSARELLSGSGEEVATSANGAKGRRAFWIALGSGVTALVLVIVAIKGGENSGAGLFFGAGGLLLVAGLAGAASGLARLARKVAAQASLTDLGWRNASRRRKRSLAVLGLLACGSFLVVAVGANRLNANIDAAKRSSGTGGFALIGESSLPVVQNLDSVAGRDFYGLDAKALAGVATVPLRVRDGEDASCLNLNRAQRPRVLGVRPEALAQRGAFTFAKLAEGAVKDKPWLTLKRGSFYPAAGQPLAADEVAAIGDDASIQWALGKKLGDTIEYTDDRGRPFKLRIVGTVANSILQGSLLIAEDEFVTRFPNESGYRMFLIDAPSNEATNVAATLGRALQGVGLELTPATRRLAAFNAVQNTYLSTFQVLGGLGLLLGSAGLGVVVLRNVLERRGELALLLAVGFRPGAVKWLVMAEHAGLLCLGLGIGVVAALVAVLPALLSPGAEIPYVSLAITVGAVLLSGLLWTWLASWVALRGRLLDALRND